ncbi:hypothetical protein Kisp01_70750 [Kineosporia sp. NBRC 101677]|uniref:glycosyltransferase n=1 Tax=Kineosporia sp. NBRC 101677 TaxID=3032197 RepID=UPI0024A32E63|nr:glycosyltransferase [Kineosporia sp. NBRC 101677]GLY20061.1 hypothetical protein Kisp01_70750 [Kineosporia sp. NBRC 101677]
MSSSTPVPVTLPSVSVVIACRNAARELGTQLAALTQQRYSGAWEVIISDNGSTDRTREVAQSYKSEIPQLRIVDSSNRPGPGHARNVAARASTADYLLFCDADDEVASDWIAAMMARLPESGLVAGRFEARKLNSTRAMRSRPLQQDVGLQTSPFGPALPHAGAGNMGIATTMFLSAGGFDPTLRVLEDTDLCWRLQLTGAQMLFVPEAVVHVRLRHSLTDMWHQGDSYGRAAALLEHRYDLMLGPAKPSGRTSQNYGNTTAKLWKMLRSNPTPGALLWTIGWHWGYRRRS